MADNKVTYKIPAGRSSFVLGFRHPVIKDGNNNGKKIQRGAGTSDEKEVKALVEQLQELVSDEKWHSPSKREEAMGRFDKIVVEAFYDCMPNVVEDSTVLDVIPMETLKEGYITMTLMGMSGAGKTTLLRRLLGTTKNAFPATSTNRTTTCDIEAIKAKQDKYELAVQFITRNELEADLLDNINDSIEYIMGIAQEEDFIDDIQLLIMILNHEEMATRLTYTLGMPELYTEDGKPLDEEDEEDDEDEDGEILDTFSLPEYEVDIDKQDKLLWDIERKVKVIGERYLETGKPFSEIQDAIPDDDEVLTVIDDIVNAVMGKFDLLKGGKRTNPKGLWPEGWYFSADNYDEFIKKAKIFVSVSSKAWGKLLTPIVKRIRVKGPFVADGETEVVPGIITDGMGLGHETNYSSIPASTLMRCEKADVITFVDNAASPMMANSKEALKSLIEYGYADKIIPAFTKMDLVKGSNYRGMSDKKAQAVTALDNYLRYLRKQENTVLSETEVRHIHDNCVFFSKLKEDKITPLTAKGFSDLREKSNRIVSKHIETDDVCLSYEALKLYYYLKEAISDFRGKWSEVTGYSAITAKTQHWSRIKALSRRLGLLGEEKYCELQPLADFGAIVQAGVNNFINQPESVLPSQTSEEVSDELKRIIKRSIGRGFSEINRKRMWTDEDPLSEWVKAFNEKGRGSTSRRARIIENIFDKAAPILADIPNLTEEQEEYLHEVIQLVDNVLNEHGCQLKRFSY